MGLQLIKSKFNSEILQFNLGQAVQRVVLESFKKLLPDTRTAGPTKLFTLLVLKRFCIVH